MVPPLPSTRQAPHKSHSSTCPQAFCPVAAVDAAHGGHRPAHVPSLVAVCCRTQVLVPTLCTAAPVVRRCDIVVTVTMATTDPSLRQENMDNAGLHTHMLVLCLSAPLRIPEPSITPQSALPAQVPCLLGVASYPPFIACTRDCGGLRPRMTTLLSQGPAAAEAGQSL